MKDKLLTSATTLERKGDLATEEEQMTEVVHTRTTARRLLILS